MGTDSKEWPEPTAEMVTGNALFESIWQGIKTWDINVPGAYGGYCGADGKHVRAIYDAIMANALKAEIHILPRKLIDGTRSGWWSLLVETEAGFRMPTADEAQDYASQDD